MKYSLRLIVSAVVYMYVLLSALELEDLDKLDLNTGCGLKVTTT